MVIKKRERVIFQIEPELKERLKIYAEKDGRTLSNLVHRILDEWDREHGLGKEEIQKKRRVNER